MKVKDFWSRVRSLAKEKHVTQAMMAEACGLPYSTFRKWISNNVIPPLDVASGLSGYFNVSIDYLTYGKTPDENKIGEFLVLMKDTNNKLREIQKHI